MMILWICNCLIYPLVRHTNEWWRYATMSKQQRTKVKVIYVQ